MIGLKFPLALLTHEFATPTSVTVSVGIPKFEIFATRMYVDVPTHAKAT